MDFITSLQFLQADKKVQKAVLDWWKPSEGDLFRLREDFLINMIVTFSNNHISYRGSKDSQIHYKNECIPLLTIGQLIKFIEDKTDSKVFYHYNCDKTISVYRAYFKNNEYNTKIVEDKSNLDLLQTLWGIACEVS